MASPDVLVVCSANVARSPLLAARLRAEADARVGAGRIEIASVGVDARPGRPAAEGSRIVVRRWSRSLDDHRSQHVSTILLEETGLIVTMTRQQAKAVLEGRRALASRTFTLRELIAAIRSIQDDPTIEAFTPLPRSGPDRFAHVVSLADSRRPSRIRARRWDVPDPTRSGIEVYEALGEEFDTAAALLGDMLFGRAADQQSAEDRSRAQRTQTQPQSPSPSPSQASRRPTG